MDGLGEGFPSPERRPGSTSAAGSWHPLPHSLEDDEEEMIKNMPWMKVRHW